MENNKQEKIQSRPKGHGPMGMMRGGEKAKDFKNTMKKLLKYISPYAKSLIIVLILAVASTIFTIVSPKILGKITNQIVDDFVNMFVYDKIVENLPEGMSIPEGTTGEDFLKTVPEEMIVDISEDKLERIKSVDLSRRPQIQFDIIGKMVLLLICIYLVSALFSYIQGWIMSGVSQKITYEFRKSILAKISKLPISYFDKQTYGEVLSRVTNDVDTVSQNLNQGLIQIVTSVTTLLGILVMMLTISTLLTLVAIVILPISFLLIILLVKKSQKLFKRHQDALGEINSHIEEMYGGHTVVKVFNGEERSLKNLTVSILNYMTVVGNLNSYLDYFSLL